MGILNNRHPENIHKLHLSSLHISILVLLSGNVHSKLLKNCDHTALTYEIITLITYEIITLITDILENQDKFLPNIEI